MKKIDILNDLNYISNLEETLNESDIDNSSRFGYWNHIGNDYPIKLTIEEIKQILKKRLQNENLQQNSESKK